MKEFRELIYNEHDVVCNQKYADTLPYSTHLSFVEAQGKKFQHLLPIEWVKNTGNHQSVDISIKEIVRYALISHDCLEDARMTYNNLIKACDTLGNYKAAVMVADIVYCVTDEKGTLVEKPKIKIFTGDHIIKIKYFDSLDMAQKYCKGKFPNVNVIFRDE